MSTAIEAMLNAILHNGDAVIGFLRGTSRLLDETLVPGWFIILNGLKHVINPATILFFLVALVLTIFVLAASIAVHILWIRLFGKSCVVFISYHHEHMELMQSVSSALTQAGLQVHKLPFLQLPDHDETLDETRVAIQICDLVLCIPGSVPSFVDHEVAMALALTKPLIMVSGSRSYASIPNTAKKGLPVFRAEALQSTNFRALAWFCLYVSKDKKSTLDLYRSALDHVAACFSLVLAAFLFFVVALGLGFHASSFAEAQSLHLKGLILEIFTSTRSASMMLSIALIFALPYFVFVGTRMAVRRQVGCLLGKQLFSDSAIPNSMGHSLARDDLVASLFHGPIVPHHELKNVNLPVDTQRLTVDKVDFEAFAINLRARRIHESRCPRCNGSGPVDVHSHYRIWSALLTRRYEFEVLSCTKCARARQVKSILYSACLGWWGPWGLIYTPFLIVRNVVALLSPPALAYPSNRLVQMCALMKRGTEVKP